MSKLTRILNKLLKICKALVMVAFVVGLILLLVGIFFNQSLILIGGYFMLPLIIIVMIAFIAICIESINL